MFEKTITVSFQLRLTRYLLFSIQQMSFIFYSFPWVCVNCLDRWERWLTEIKTMINTSGLSPTISIWSGNISNNLTSIMSNSTTLLSMMWPTCEHNVQFGKKDTIFEWIFSKTYPVPLSLFHWVPHVLLCWI